MNYQDSIPTTVTVSTETVFTDSYPDETHEKKCKRKMINIIEKFKEFNEDTNNPKNLKDILINM